MLFPVSGVEVNPLILPLIFLVIPPFTSMPGISGVLSLSFFQVSILNVTSLAVSLVFREYNHLFGSGLNGVRHANA